METTAHGQGGGPGRLLVLVRHEQAARADGGDGGGDGGGDDHDRPLTGRGRRDAAALGGWLAQAVGCPGAVLCSSALRTLQTWQLAAAQLTGAPVADVRDELYLASPGTLLAALRACPPGVRTLLAVGHEPVQSTLTRALAGAGSSAQALTALAVGFSPGAVAVLAVDGEWADLAPGGSRLVDLAVPRG